MPAPKNPNTAAATAAVRRRGQETMAAKLRAAGWTCTPPECTDNTPKSHYGIRCSVCGAPDIPAGQPCPYHEPTDYAQRDDAGHRMPCDRIECQIGDGA